MNTDLFGNPIEVDTPPPTGLMDDGLVRTTGWLQFGDRLISSGVVSALVCAPHAVLVALALWQSSAVAALLAVVLIPLVGSGVWLLVNTLLPASKARNVEPRQARDLTAGLLVRLYGSIGVVGRVRTITAVTEDDVEIRFYGGTVRTWAGGHQVQVVELLN